MTAVGIGGFFFRSSDPGALQTWYADHLGVKLNDGYQWPQEAGPTVFMPFKNDTDYFPADKQWTMNFRVVDFDAMLGRLRDAGIEVITKAEWDTPETGRFARISDPEGNQIELWEPPVE